MPPRLEQVVATALGIPAERVHDELSFNSISEWDSLNHVTLMLDLEREFGVAITEEEMIELSSVSAIRAFLEAPRPAAGPRSAGDA